MTHAVIVYSLLDMIFVCVYTGSSGSVTFRNVPLRGERNTPYSLRVLARNTDGVRTDIRTSVRPGELRN